MQFQEHLFHATCFKCELSYVMSYFFFLVSMSFIVLITTQTKLFNAGDDIPVIHFIIITIWAFISLFVSRVICYKKEDEFESNALLYESNV